MRSTDPKLELLATLDVLDDVPPAQLRLLALEVDEVTVPTDEILIHQGQLNRHAYFVVAGTLGIEVDGERIATVSAGSIVGERTAIERGFANATVVVVEDATVLAVDHRVLLGAASQDDTLADRLQDLATVRTNVALNRAWRRHLPGAV